MWLYKLAFLMLMVVPPFSYADNSKDTMDNSQQMSFSYYDDEDEQSASYNALCDQIEEVPLPWWRVTVAKIASYFLVQYRRLTKALQIKINCCGYNLLKARKKHA